MGAFSGCESLEKVTLPDSLTEIPDECFDGCSSLSYLEIPASVVSIGTNAFQGCIGLTSLDLPQALETIGYDAFKGCVSLREICIPDSVTSIKSGAFGGCSADIVWGEHPTVAALEGTFKGYAGEEIEIPVSGSSIWSETFNNTAADILWPQTSSGIVLKSLAFCGYLGKELSIPDYVTFEKIDFPLTFQDCENLISLELPEMPYSLGELFSKVPASLKTVTVRGGIVAVNAFSGNTSLETVVLGDAVTQIGGMAFYGCDWLTQLRIPERLTDIGSSAFEGCSALTDVYISDLGAWCGITFGSETSNPFYYAKNVYAGEELLTDWVIPDGVTSIGRYAFVNAMFLKSIVIPNSVETIAYMAFAGCENLESMTLPFAGESAGGTENTYFGYIFGYANDAVPASLKTVVISGSGDVPEYAFSYCASIESVTIEAAENIGPWAFKGCEGLKSVTVGENIRDIGQSSFRACTSLTRFEIREGAHGVALRESVFNGCTNLSEVLLADSVTTIESMAFVDCSSLKSMIIPEGALSLGSAIFRGGCSSLESVKLPSGITEVPSVMFSECRSLVNIDIPNGVKSIGSTAFEQCVSITELIIPDSVTSIGETAFMSCSALKEINLAKITAVPTEAFRGCTSLTKVVIPDGVTTIGERAFSECSLLRCVVIPESMGSIAADAFINCYRLIEVYNLSSLNITAGSEEYGQIARYAENVYTSLTEESKITQTADGWVLYADDSAQKYYLVCYARTGTELTLPADIEGCAYEIRAYAFISSRLTSVTVSRNVTCIGESAFRGCLKLTDIYFDGTTEEWDAVEKAEQWSYASGDFTIHCSDGDVEKDIFSL